MATIRTFFWHERVKPRGKLWWDRKVRGKAWDDFLHGNAGDILTREVLARTYPGTTPINVKQGPRILCVGSLAHQVKAGDVLSGIGCRTDQLPAPNSSNHYIHGLRGPISYDIFKSAGYDVSQVKFLADPGLLIGGMVPDRAPKKGHVVFVPHYRERKIIRKRVPPGIHIIDIDNIPLRIAHQIQRAECVYSSSLHGIVFSHALKRPCVLVRPATQEPMLKFEDYFLSVGINPPIPLDSIADAKFARAPTSPAALTVDIAEIVFPSEAQLRSRGVILE